MTRDETIEGGASGDGPDASWFACYTRSRHEKKVDARLRSQGVECFLPLVERTSEWHDRTKVVEWPLFPGYLFTRVERRRLHSVRDTSGVVTVITFDGAPAPIPDEEIEGVRRFAEGLGEAGLETEPAGLPERGERVRVLDGPLEGVEGRVVEHRGSGRVMVVGLEAIRQGVKLEMDASRLEIVRRAS